MTFKVLYNSMTWLPSPAVAACLSQQPFPFLLPQSQDCEAPSCWHAGMLASTGLLLALNI